MPPRNLINDLVTHLSEPENITHLQNYFNAEYDKARTTDPAAARRIGRTLDKIDAAITASAAPKATGTPSTGGDAAATPPKNATKSKP